MFLHFWTSEDGAITVDWTLITAATVGLGLSSAAAVRTGVVSMGESVDTSLSGAQVSSLRRLGSSVLGNFNFEDGNFAGWNTTRTGEVEGYGNVLGPFGGPETRNNPITFDAQFEEGTGTGIVEFDMLVLDSWDGEGRASSAEGDAMILSINGQDVAVESFMFRGHPDSAGFPERTGDRYAQVTVGDTTYTVNMTQTREGQYGNTGGAPDQTWRVTVTADNPPPNVQIGLAGGTHQSTSDESFAIDNMIVLSQ